MALSSPENNIVDDLSSNSANGTSNEVMQCKNFDVFYAMQEHQYLQFDVTRKYDGIHTLLLP